MQLFKKITAGVCALGITVACAAQTSFTGSVNTVFAATKDVSSTMEWGALKIGGGGFVSAVVAGQNNMYARTDVGGAYKYNYATDEWEQLFGFINEADKGMLSVSGIAIDPTDDDTVYFLCGCAYFSDARTAIYKTTDGGKTFTTVDVTDLIQVHANGDGRECSEPIAVDPDDPNTIYAGGDVTAGESCLIKSTDGGKTWKPVKGYDDLGMYTNEVKWPTWTDHTARCITKGEYNTHNGVATIKIVGGKVYVGTSVAGQTNIHVASVKDDKFTALSKDLPTANYPVSISYDNNGHLYFTYIAGLAFAGGSGGMFKYDIASGKVTDVSPDRGAFGTVAVDKNDPDKLVTRTCGVWSSQWWSDEWTDDTIAWGDWFYRSEDGGATWENVTPGVKADQYTANEHFVSLPLQTGGYDWIYGKAIHWGSTVVLDPNDPDKIVTTSGNGMFACDNIWDEQGVQFYFHPDGIEEVVSLDFVSTADGLDLSAIGDYDGFVHNSVREIGLQYKPNMGSTSAIAVCPQNTDVWARTAEGDANNNGSAFYTTDRGQTWKAFKPACTGGKLSITELSAGKYRVINTSKTGGVSYSDDWGATWKTSSGIKATKGVYTLVDPEDAKTVYASVLTHNDYWASDYSKKEPTLEESHYAFAVSHDYGATFTETTVCKYDMCDHTGDLAYLGNGSIVMAAGWYGMYTITDGKAEKMDNVFYAKCIGYGAPEKAGDPNTLYFYGRPEESDPEGIYRSQDGGKTWVCINTDHIYGGTGNGNYIVGDMDEFGKIYMSTVGCGIIYGQLAGSDPQPITTTTTKAPASTTTTTKTTTTTGSGKVTLLGDANVDEKVTVADAVAILQSLANKDKYALKPQGALNADCFDPGDGVTGKDALAIQRLDAKEIAALPDYSK